MNACAASQSCQVMNFESSVRICIHLWFQMSELLRSKIAPQKLIGLASNWAARTIITMRNPDSRRIFS